MVHLIWKQVTGVSEFERFSIAWLACSIPWYMSIDSRLFGPGAIITYYHLFPIGEWTYNITDFLFNPSINIFKRSIPLSIYSYTQPLYPSTLIIPCLVLFFVFFFNSRYNFSRYKDIHKENKKNQYLSLKQIVTFTPWSSEYLWEDQFFWQQWDQPFDQEQRFWKWWRPYQYADGYHHHEDGRRGS